MRNYSANDYKVLVENINMPKFKSYIDKEIEYISNQISKSKDRTFIELGAGYGRIVPFIVGNIKNYIGVEINHEMFEGLDDYCQMYTNVESIYGNMIHLNDLFKGRSLNNVVVLLLQNTLGVVEGDLGKVKKALKKFFKYRNGDLIVSVLKSERLSDFGLEFYDNIKEISGNYDASKSDLENGVFITDSGYQSKWWKKEEVESFSKEIGGKIEDVYEGKEFYIFRIGFANGSFKHKIV